MTYYLGSTSNSDEFLLLKNNKKIEFSLNSKSIPGTKKFFNSNYLSHSYCFCLQGRLKYLYNYNKNRYKNRKWKTNC